MSNKTIEQGDHQETERPVPAEVFDDIVRKAVAGAAVYTDTPLDGGFGDAFEPSFVKAREVTILPVPYAGDERPPFTFTYPPVNKFMRDKPA